jgi:hypothetical protein
MARQVAKVFHFIVFKPPSYLLARVKNDEIYHLIYFCFCPSQFVFIEIEKRYDCSQEHSSKLKKVYPASCICANKKGTINISIDSTAP